MFTAWQKTRERPTEEPAKPHIIRKRSMKGLLDVDGWKCNCNPRLPAIKFTTRNRGINHGREYYKCSNSDTGCEFFLWESEARARETRMDPKPVSKGTPTLPPTPTTGTRRHTRANPNPENVVESPFKRHISTDQQSYDSDIDSETEDLEPYMSWRETANFSNGLATPRKQRRTDTQSSPSKPHNAPLYQSHLPYVPTERRTSPRLQQQQGANTKTPPRGPPSDPSLDNIFTTPPSAPAHRTIFDPRPSTPPPNLQPTYANPVTPGSRNIGSPGRGLQDTLISDTFKLLDRNSVNLTTFAGDLRALLMRHVRQKEGISQGRETLRQALARKDLEFSELKTKIEGLENKSEKLMMDKRILLEENVRMLEEEKKMKAEVASLSSQLERVRLSQTQKQLTQSTDESLDTSYLHIK